MVEVHKSLTYASMVSRESVKIAMTWDFMESSGGELFLYPSLS